MAVNTPIGQLKAKKALENKRKRACTDLRYLAVDILGYDWMSGPWHKKIFKFIDDNRNEPRVAVFSPRYSYKSRIQICEIIQEMIRNPDIYIALVHHKLDLARELVVEVGELIQKNDSLRGLLGRNAPSKRYTSFIKASQGGELTLLGTNRAKPTLKGFSADQDLTGAHPDMIFLDDVISAKTIEYFNGIEGLRNWIRHTIIPLAGASGKMRVKGTMWSSQDWYSDIMDSSIWKWVKHAILEDEEGNPDEKNGKPIEIYVGDPAADGGKRFLTMADIERYKQEMMSHFSGQMMNEPFAEGSRPWNPERCEHYIPLSSIRNLIKKVVIFTDPAPLGLTDDGKLMHADGTKDYWSIAVIGYLKSKTKTVRVLLDGKASQNWDMDKGLIEIKKLMRKYSVKIVGIEEPPMLPKGVSFYGKSLKEKFSRGDGLLGQGCKPIRLKATHKGKSPRIFDLCSMAGMQDENGDPDPLFLICEDTIDDEFLKMFLFQIRNWAGKNSIAHDDVIDVIAYLEDPSITPFISLGGDPVLNEWWSTENKVTPQARRTRYCSA